MGFETHTAHDGPSALAAAERTQPHLALLDIGLPVMDGYELASHLRARGEGSDLRLVAITGYGTASDVARSRAAGFHAHLVKPVTPDALHAALEEILR